MMTERRYIPRWNVQRNTSLRLAGAFVSANCVLNDINLRGMRLALKLKLPRDVFIKLRIILSEEITLEAEVWVAWHKVIDGHNLYGLYFAKISDEEKEKIYKFICANFPEQVRSKLCTETEMKKHPALSDGPVCTSVRGGESMEKNGSQDKRIFERFKAEMPVRYLEVDSNQEGSAKIVDISAKGLGLVSNQELKPKTALELWLAVPDHGQPLYTRGEVVWAQPQGAQGYRMGVNLEKADLMGLSRILRVR